MDDSALGYGCILAIIMGLLLMAFSVSPWMQPFWDCFRMVIYG